MNLLVAIQGCLDLATHWLADAGWEVPASYAEVFTGLARHGVIDSSVACLLLGAPSVIGQRLWVRVNWAVMPPVWTKFSEVPSPLISP